MKRGIGAILMLCLAAVLWAEPQAVETPQPPQESSVNNTELLTPIQQKMTEEISLDFKETPIEDVLRILSQQADVDIVKSPKVIGTVTATLTDVPLSEALENILSAHGYGFVATNNMIRIVPKEEINEVREKIVSRVYRITYADVKEVETALRKFISETGSISANPGTSNIIVTDAESKINAINSFIEEIDRVTPQILVEAKIYDISSTDNLDLGIEWQAGTTTSYGAIPPGGSLGDQVGNLGNVLSGQTADNGLISRTEPFTTGKNAGVVNKAKSSDGLIRMGYLDENVYIDAILHAAQEDIRAKLLANPRIMVVDNQQAQIKIVEEIPYQELTQTSGGGNIGTTQFRDVGVELIVTPHLTREGLIRLILNPKFSVRTGDVLVGGNSSVLPPQPIVAKRETVTTALIKDKQTVVIGGLQKQDVTQQVNKIPLLGDLPLLGVLFRFEGESTVNSELVVFITPNVILEPTLTDREQLHLNSTVFAVPKAPETRLGNESEK